MTLKGKLPGWMVLSLFGVLGGLMVVLPRLVSGITWLRSYEGISDGIGIAFLTAFLLGFTIDRWMKGEIQRDAVIAALGYIPPAEFRAEMLRIVQFKFMCEKHFMHIKIDKIDDEHVRVTAGTERLMRNITARRERMAGYMHIDEWGFPFERSNIDICEIEGPSGKVLVCERPEILDDSTIKAVTQELTVGPNECASVRSKTTEIRRINDSLVWLFLTPTKNPEVHIDAPADIHCTFSFGPIEQKTESSRFLRKFRLDGVYFPPAHMRARWWPENPKP